MAAGGAVLLTRRALLGSAVALPVLPLAGLPRTDWLEFHLIREGSQIGSHVLKFRPHPDGVAISIAVDIAVRFGPFVLYRYKLRGEEVWRSGRCVHASSTTDDDGTAQFMRAVRRGEGLMVEGSGISPYVAPANAMIASHWNQAELNGPWINLQNGKLLHPHVKTLGPDPVLLANGATTPASCYSITGPAQIRIWYTPASIWTGLVFVAKDGSNVRYERVT
jgi:hypothetical protein